MTVLLHCTCWVGIRLSKLYLRYQLGCLPQAGVQCAHSDQGRCHTDQALLRCTPCSCCPELNACSYELSLICHAGLVNPASTFDPNRGWITTVVHIATHRYDANTQVSVPAWGIAERCLLHRLLAGIKRLKSLQPDTTLLRPLPQ